MPRTRPERHGRKAVSGEHERGRLVAMADGDVTTRRGLHLPAVALDERFARGSGPGGAPARRGAPGRPGSTPSGAPPSASAHAPGARTAIDRRPWAGRQRLVPPPVVRGRRPAPAWPARARAGRPPSTLRRWSRRPLTTRWEPPAGLATVRTWSHRPSVARVPQPR